MIFVTSWIELSQQCDRASEVTRREKCQANERRWKSKIQEVCIVVIFVFWLQCCVCCCVACRSPDVSPHKSVLRRNMDVECEENCRVVGEKWPESTLHYERPQVGHSRPSGRLHRQGDHVLWTNVNWYFCSRHVLWPVHSEYCYPLWALKSCRISPRRFLADSRMRQLNQASFVLLYFVLFTFVSVVFNSCIFCILICLLSFIF